MIAKIEDKNRRTEQVDNERSPFDLLMSLFFMSKGQLYLWESTYKKCLREE